MRFVTGSAMMFLACVGLGALVLAQPQPGTTAAGADKQTTAPPLPDDTVVGLSLSYADPHPPRIWMDDILNTVAYLAADPAIRDRSDYQIPKTGKTKLGFGVHEQLTPQVTFFVGNPKARPNGIAVQLAAQGADKKELLQAAAQRVVQALTGNKLPKDQRDGRLRELDEQINKIHDKKSLLETVAKNTAALGPEILKERIKAAELERQRLEMDLAAQRARSDAIAKEIDRIRQQAEEKLHGDAVLKQLREVVKLREEQRARVKQLLDTGSSSQSDVAQADEQVMNANLRVTEREEAIRVGTNSILLERLNAELASNMINRAEMEVRLELIRRQQPSIDVEDLDEDKLNRLTDEYRALFRNTGTLPPLYFQLEKQQAELLVQKLALLVSEVKVGDVTVTTQPAQ